MNIVLQAPANFDTADPVYQKIEALMRSAARFKRPDTELIFNPTRGLGIKDMEEIGNLGTRYRHDSAILDGMIAAATDHIDGMVTNCFFDNALWPARQMLDIPVVGLAEASMSLATFMGRRFAIIPVSPRYARPMEDMIDLYGYRASAIACRPVRAYEAEEREAVGWLMENRLDRLVEVFTPVARGCIADGADILIFGCGLASVLLGEGAGMAELDGVPIITPIVAAVKAIETMVDLQKGGMRIKSNVGYWGTR